MKNNETALILDKKANKTENDIVHEPDHLKSDQVPQVTSSHLRSPQVTSGHLKSP